MILFWAHFDIPDLGAAKARPVYLTHVEDRGNGAGPLAWCWTLNDQMVFTRVQLAGAQIAVKPGSMDE